MSFRSDIMILSVLGFKSDIRIELQAPLLYPIYVEWNFPPLSIGLVHLSFKGCWVGFNIQILIEHSISKQWRPWSDATRRRRQRPGVDAIKYHTLPRTPHGKVTKHKETSHTREPRGHPFPSRGSQGCKKHTREYDKDKHK